MMTTKFAKVQVTCIKQIDIKEEKKPETNLKRKDFYLTLIFIHPF